MMHFLSLALIGINFQLTVPVNVTIHCDNFGTLELSQDNGSTFQTIVSEPPQWQTPLTATLPQAQVTSDTILRLTCRDNGGPGGVIATVTYNGTTYSTAEPIEAGLWTLQSSSDNVTAPLVYRDKTSAPWRISTAGIADDAKWIWNRNTHNTMVFEFDFENIGATDNPSSSSSSDPTPDPSSSSSPTRHPTQQPRVILTAAPSSALSAKVTIHCDNRGTLQLSTTNGSTFGIIDTENNWRNPMTAILNQVTNDTILKLTCRDVGVIGGVIATVSYNGTTYSTTEPIENGSWTLQSSSDGITAPLIYHDKTSAPWRISTADIADDAKWIWNEHIDNTMVFQFDFESIIGFTV